MKYLLFILLVLPGVAIGQAVSMSSGAVAGLSGIVYAGDAMISYRIVDLHLVWTTDNVNIRSSSLREKLDVSLGITLSPELDFNWLSAEPIIGYYHKPVASEFGSRLNFGLTIYRRILPRVDLYIRHISNANTGHLNPGVDMLGVRASL